MFLIMGKTMHETNMNKYINIVNGSSEIILLKISYIPIPPNIKIQFIHILA